MENFRKMREEDEAKRAASAAKRVQEEAEAEEASSSFREKASSPWVDENDDLTIPAEGES